MKTTTNLPAAAPKVPNTFPALYSLKDAPSCVVLMIEPGLGFRLDNDPRNFKPSEGWRKMDDWQLFEGSITLSNQ